MQCLSEAGLGEAGFSWSEQLDKAREKVFRISNCRPDQLAVMNASLAGHDCLLIMPTWAGHPSIVISGQTEWISGGWRQINL